MKKSICLLLTVCVFLSAFSVSSFAALTNDEITLNFDYNGDGSVNLEDARTVLRVSAGIEAPKDGLIYDIAGNNDGVTFEDVKKVISIVTGIDTEVTECAEFNLSLFRGELNNVKKERPGFTKTSETQCLSMLVTTKNAPDSSLNVTNMPFDQYTNKSCDYLEDMIDGPLGIMISSSQKSEMKAQIADMRKQAAQVYDKKITTSTVAKRGSHYAGFPVNNLGNSCFLEVSDIKSIECYEEDGYIIRVVTMNEDTYIGDEYPTGYEGSSQRWKEISYGKVFNIPELSEKEGDKETSIVNKVTFKDGKIISKIDKLSGLPVSVDYSYTYTADISTIPEIDQNGKEGLQMDSVTTATVKESFVLNPVTNN